MAPPLLTSASQTKNQRKELDDLREMKEDVERREKAQAEVIAQQVGGCESVGGREGGWLHACMHACVLAWQLTRKACPLMLFHNAQRYNNISNCPAYHCQPLYNTCSPAAGKATGGAGLAVPR